MGVSMGPGSMIDTLDSLKIELSRSLRWLGENTKFHLVFFSAGKPVEFSPRQLVVGTTDNKMLARKFIHGLTAENQTDPIPALKGAFEVLKRDKQSAGKVIYLLTDGVFPDNRAVLSVIDKYNAKKDVRIHTFLYGTRPPEAVDVMQRIAKGNGGHYRYVSLDE